MSDMTFQILTMILFAYPIGHHLAESIRISDQNEERANTQMDMALQCLGDLSGSREARNELYPTNPGNSVSHV